MIKLILLVIFYLTFPLLIIYLCKKWTFLEKLGSIVIAYAFGLLIGSTGVFPKGSEGYKLAVVGRGPGQLAARRPNRRGHELRG